MGKSGQQPAGAFVATGLSDADPTRNSREVGGDTYDPYDYEGNLEEAKRLLAEAGYPNGEGLPTMEYLYNESTGHQLIGEAIQSMGKEIGVNIETPLHRNEIPSLIPERTASTKLPETAGWVTTTILFPLLGYVGNRKR